jgi:hypothetical protein
MKNTPRCPVCGSKGLYYRKKKGDFYCKLCNSTTLYSKVIWDDKQQIEVNDALRCLKLIRDDLRATQMRLEECKLKAKAEGYSPEQIEVILYPEEPAGPEGEEDATN